MSKKILDMGMIYIKKRVLKNADQWWRNFFKNINFQLRYVANPLEKLIYFIIVWKMLDIRFSFISVKIQSFDKDLQPWSAFSKTLFFMYILSYSPIKKNIALHPERCPKYHKLTCSDLKHGMKSWYTLNFGHIILTRGTNFN